MSFSTSSKALGQGGKISGKAKATLSLRVGARLTRRQSSRERASRGLPFRTLIFMIFIGVKISKLLEVLGVEVLVVLEFLLRNSFRPCRSRVPLKETL